MNIFTLLIIAGVISLFNRLLTGGQQQEEQETSPSRATTGPQNTSTTEQSYQYGQENRDIDDEAVTFEEQRERQMEQLAGRMNTSLDVEEELENIPEYKNVINSPIQKEPALHSEEKIKMRRRIHGKLTKDGLVDSIIMAEVLGRPRALAPYKNILSKK